MQRPYFGTNVRKFNKLGASPMQGTFGEKHLHGIDPKGRLQLSRQVRDQLKLKKGDRLHLLPNIEEPPYLEVRTAAHLHDP